MADLSDGVNWFEIDNSNNKASPNGWPEGMMPSGVNDSARADKGALKRFWDRINPVEKITGVGGLWTFTTDNPAYPTAYIDGEVYCFWPLTDAIGGDQFQVNGLPAKPIWKRINTGTGFTAIVAQDILHGLPATLAYDSGLNGGAGAFMLVNPFVSLTGDGASGIVVPGSITANQLHIDPWTLHQTGGNFSFFHQPNGERAQLDPAGNGTFAGSVTGNYVHSTGNVQADNTFTGGAVSVSGAVTAGSVHSTSGNVQSDHDIVALSNIWATSGAVTAINLTATNAVTTPYVHAGAAGVLSDGNIGTPASVTASTVHSTGNVQADNTFTGGAVSVSGAVTAGSVHSTSGNVQSDHDIVAFSNIWATSGTVTAVNLTATGSVTGNYIHSSNNVQADGTFTGGSVSVSGNIQTTAGNVSSYGGFVTRDGGGGYQFGFYQSGAYNIINFATNHYLEYNISNGQLLYSALGAFWIMRQSDAHCWNQLGPTGGNGAYFDISDRRIKENIEPSSSGLDAIVQLNPVSFNRVNVERREVGFIAQDVEAVLPDAVQMFDMPVGDGSKTIPTLALTDNVIVAALVNSVKELAARVAQLETK